MWEGSRCKDSCRRKKMNKKIRNIGKKGKLGRKNLGSWKITMENILKVCDYLKKKDTTEEKNLN